MDDAGLDRALARHRAALDAEMAQSGALPRVRRSVLARHSASSMAAMPWARIAAAVLVAAMLGGALDWMLPEPALDPIEVAFGDPLSDLDVADMP